MQAIKRVEGCIQLLIQYQAEPKKALHAGGQTGDRRALFLLRGLDFGRRTLAAMNVLLENDEWAILAQTLCRPYFELAARLLWAARAEDGWQRLEMLWVDENHKWATQAVKLPEFEDRAKAVLKGAQSVLGRQSHSGKKFGLPRSVERVLEEIARKDADDGLCQPGGNTALYQYALLYRVLCRPAHGHIQAIGPLPVNSIRMHAATSALVATHLLLQALCHFDTTEPQKEVNALGEAMIKLLQATANRGADKH